MAAAAAAEAPAASAPFEDMCTRHRTVRNPGTHAADITSASIAVDVDALCQPLPDRFYVPWSTEGP